jgi:hypothetical protein
MVGKFSTPEHTHTFLHSKICNPNKITCLYHFPFKFPRVRNFYSCSKVIGQNFLANIFVTLKKEKLRKCGQPFTASVSVSEILATYKMMGEITFSNFIIVCGNKLDFEVKSDNSNGHCVGQATSVHIHFFHSCTAHINTIKVFDLPTDAQ